MRDRGLVESNDEVDDGYVSIGFRSSISFRPTTPGSYDGREVNLCHEDEFSIMSPVRRACHLEKYWDVDVSKVFPCTIKDS